MRPEERADAVQVAWGLFLRRALAGAPQPGARPVGASERLVLRNLLRERKRSDARWRRHNGRWCAAAEECAEAPAAEPEDDLGRLAQPLLDVARLLRERYEPEDIARILEVNVREVVRRAAWILLRRSEGGAVLPSHLGLEPRSLAALAPALRHQVLRALHAAAWPRELMACELRLSLPALRKALERSGLAERRR